MAVDIPFRKKDSAASCPPMPARRGDQLFRLGGCKHTEQIRIRRSKYGFHPAEKEIGEVGVTDAVVVGRVGGNHRFVANLDRLCVMIDQESVDIWMKSFNHLHDTSKAGPKITCRVTEEPRHRRRCFLRSPIASKLPAVQTDVELESWMTPRNKVSFECQRADLRKIPDTRSPPPRRTSRPLHRPSEEMDRPKNPRSMRLLRSAPWPHAPAR